MSVLCDPGVMAEQERWQVSGTAAQMYEKYVASFFVPWAADLVQRAGLRPGWALLDIACGTGVVVRAAAPVIGATGTIIGSDLNEGMLAEAATHPVEGAPVEWRQADATDLPFDDATFDAVLCQQGLQFVPDKTTAVAEMRRVVKSGGVAAANVWRLPEHNPYLSALADGLSRHVSAEAGASMLAPCGLGDREEFASLFEEAGFRSVEVDAVSIMRDPIDAIEAIEGNLAALPMSEQVQAMSEDARAALYADIVATLSDHIDDGVLHIANTSHVAVAIA